MERRWIELGVALHARLAAEARAARPGTGARRPTEKAEYCRALWLVAGRVRDWLLGEESTIQGFGCVMVQTEGDLMAATAAVLEARSAERKGWSCGLYRALSLALEVLEEAALSMDVGGSAVKMTPTVVDGMVAFRVETERSPEGEAAEAERVFFEEADRMLGRRRE